MARSRRASDQSPPGGVYLLAQDPPCSGRREPLRVAVAGFGADRHHGARCGEFPVPPSGVCPCVHHAGGCLCLSALRRSSVSSFPASRPRQPCACRADPGRGSCMRCCRSTGMVGAALASLGQARAGAGVVRTVKISIRAKRGLGHMSLTSTLHARVFEPASLECRGR